MDLATNLRRHPFAADAALAVALTGAAVVSVYTTFELLRQDPAWHAPGKGPILAVVAVTVLPLALRRRLPLVCLVVVATSFIAGRVTVNPNFPGIEWENYLTVWACWIALYSAIVHGPKSRWTVVIVVAVIGAFVADIVWQVFFYAGGTFRDLPINEAFLLAYNAVFLALPVWLGLAVRGRHERERQLAEQTDELRREREDNARRAVLEERVRIARELHDVVAHHVSVMGVQAGAARRVLATRPEHAEEALSSIEASSRQAVLELQRLLGVLRRSDQPDALEPQPGLGQLPQLLAQIEQGGLAVSMTIEGEQRPLPSTLELSAYRVIQEALTNALKHSGGRAAGVVLRFRQDVLDVEVRDDGNGRGGRAVAGGHGLIGMRERVRVHGGHLSADATATGFVVHATFPLNGKAP